MRCINVNGLELIKQCEGFRSKPYQDSVGVWTIGYGHTRGVTADTPEVTPEEAEKLLMEDIAQAQDEVIKLVKVTLNDNQFAALVSLVYNVGPSPLKLTLGTLLNEGDYEKAAEQFLRWNRAGGEILKGLVIRRESEKTLFCTSC